MKISRNNLQRIILEEYIKEETLLEELSPEQEEEMLAWIRQQGPKPDWLGDDYGTKGLGKQAPTGTPADRAADTMPIGIPSDDAPESEYLGHQTRMGPTDTPEQEDMSDDDIQSQIASLVAGKSSDEIYDIFLDVVKASGVDISGGEEEEELGTPYGGKEFERRKGQGQQAGFREQLVNEVYARILEFGPAGLGSWGMKGMAGIPYKRDVDDEEVDEGLDDYPDFEPAYDVMKGEGPPEKAPFHDVDDPHAWTDDDLNELSDEELIDFADRDGIETFYYRDRIEGTPMAHSMELSPEQRTALIDAIKNV